MNRRTVRQGALRAAASGGGVRKDLGYSVARAVGLAGPAGLRPASRWGKRNIRKRAFSRVAPPSMRQGGTRSRDARKSRLERSRLAGWHVRCPLCGLIGRRCPARSDQGHRTCLGRNRQPESPAGWSPRPSPRAARTQPADGATEFGGSSFFPPRSGSFNPCSTTLGKGPRTPSTRRTTPPPRPFLSRKPTASD